MPVQTDFEKRLLPFRQPDTLIGSSENSQVFGYQDVPRVVKIPLPKNTQRFEDVETAENEARGIQQREAYVADYIVREGVSKEVVPRSTSVIYQESPRIIRIATVQPHIEGAKPLSDSGINVLSMSDEALRSLRGILRANVKLWKNEGKIFDLVGTAPKQMQQNYLGRVVNHIFPIFRSHNIISDGGKQVYFVDSAQLIEPSAKNVHQWLGKNLFAAGTALSLGLINGVLKKRELSNRINKRK